MLQRPHEELLKVVPLAAIVGQLKLSGDAFKRQLELGYSSYTLINPDLGFITFVGLHDVSPDGHSGNYFWMIMRPDNTVAEPGHWLQTASKQEKLDHVLAATKKLSPRFREIFELTPVDGIKEETHIWRDIELDSLPAGRVVLMGDAAHAMTPFRGEGGYHTFLDALALSKILVQLNSDGKVGEIEAVKASIEEYNAEMLERGTRSVRFSRQSYDEAKKKVENRQAFLAPMKSLEEKEVVLEIKA